MSKKVCEKPSPLKYRRGDPLQLDVRDEAIHRHAPRETEEVEFLETVSGQQHYDHSVLFPLGRLKEELQGRISKYHGIRDRCTDFDAGVYLGVQIGELKEVLAIIQRLETEGDT